MKEERLKVKRQEFNVNHLLEASLNDTTIERLRRENSIAVSEESDDEVVRLIVKDKKRKLKAALGFEPRSLTDQKQPPSEAEEEAKSGVGPTRSFQAVEELNN